MGVRSRALGEELNKEEGSMDGRGVPENQKVKLHQEIRRNPCLGGRFSFFCFVLFLQPVSVSFSFSPRQYLKEENSFPLFVES